jgi:hypothetical protein
MATEPALLTPLQRLAISRAALVQRFEGRPARPVAEAPRRAGIDPLGRERYQRFAWSSLGRSLARRWWRRHPAHAIGQLALPLLDRYAHEQPARLVAAAAATGALAALVKPWRLLSVGAVLAALLKTSDVADLVTTTLARKTANPRKEPP